MLLPETLKLHDQTRFEFHYIYFLPWKDQMVGDIQHAGGKVTCLSASNNIQIIRKVNSIISYIRKNQIQLVHCHLPWAGLVGRLVFKRTGIPMLYTEHNKQERYHFLTRLMNQVTFNWQTAAIAVSEDVALSIKKNIHPRIPVQVILNGVNTASFQRNEADRINMRQQLDIPKDAFVIGTIAVFRFQKRLKEWLDVFKVAAEENPNLYGIIVGDGPLRVEIEAHRKHLGLDEKVIMPGLQTEVQPWYSAMDVFMMTSIFEGLPIALLEAMSMECAIVSTDAGGIKQVVRNEVDGVTVSVDSWRDLPDELKKLGQNDITRLRLSKAARERVSDAFSLKRMVFELESLYKESV